MSGCCNSCAYTDPVVKKQLEDLSKQLAKNDSKDFQQDGCITQLFNMYRCEVSRAVTEYMEVMKKSGDLDELEIAYCLSVHKSQGSEYRAVILTAWNGSPYLLSRSILYTAITRARELLIIVGREETVAVMTENAKKTRRYSGLKLRLQGKCE